MEFPVYLTIGTLKIHPHPVFESLAYFISLRLALHRFRQNPLAQEHRGVVIAGGIIGGILGAKILAIFQHLDMLWTGAASYDLLFGFSLGDRFYQTRFSPFAGHECYPNRLFTRTDLLPPSNAAINVNYLLPAFAIATAV